jgi:biotin carboxylase
MAVTTGATRAPTEPRVAANTVLIGFANALAAPETAWSLLESGCKVVAFARRGKRCALRRSRDVRIVDITPPEEDARSSAAEITAVARDLAARAVVPLDDMAVWLCDAAVQQGLSYPILGPTGAAAELALDKGLQIGAASEAGFSVPPTRSIDSSDDLRLLSELPLVLKPARAVSYDGARLRRGAGHVCGTPAELDAAVRTWAGRERLLAQPLIRGVGEGLFGLAGANGLLAVSAHRRIRMANPQGSGSSACISTAVDPGLAAAAHRMLTEAGWEGMFMLEFLRGEDGTAWFMELNGRPWGSMALARRLGLEYPAWALRQLSEPDFQPTYVLREGQVCRHLGRELVHLMMVLRGPRSVALTKWPSRRGTLREVLHLSRDDCWYNTRAGDRHLFVADAIETVLECLPRPTRR